MKKYLKLFLLAVTLFVSVFSFQTYSSPTASAADCGGSFLGIPPWYEGLTDSKCDVKSPKDVTGGVQGFTVKVAGNILAMLLSLVAYVALGFVLYGSFRILTSNGNPDLVAKGRSTIQGALIGMIISVSARAITGQAVGLFDNYNNEQGLLRKIILLVLTLGASIAILMIVINGLRMVTGGSNPDTVAKARRGITYALVGLILLVLSWAIVDYVIGRF